MATQSLSLRVLHIADPCTVPWSSMRGDDRTRFCGQCRKNVYNIEHLSDAEANELLTRSESPCVRFRRRRDGTVVTRDCSRVKLWCDRLRSIAAACVAAVLCQSGAGCEPEVRYTAGAHIDDAALVEQLTIAARQAATRAATRGATSPSSQPQGTNP